MKDFVSPKLEIVRHDVNDILSTSTQTEPSSEDPREDITTPQDEFED